MMYNILLVYFFIHSYLNYIIILINTILTYKICLTNILVQQYVKITNKMFREKNMLKRKKKSKIIDNILNPSMEKSIKSMIYFFLMRWKRYMPSKKLQV